MSEAPTSEPVIRITYQAPIAEGKGIAFETYVGLSTPKAVIDGVIDKLRAVVDRQEAIVKVAILQKEITANGLHLEALKKDYKRVRDESVERWTSSGRQGKYKPTEAEFKHGENTKSSIAAREHQNSVLEAELAHYAALVTPVDTSE